DVPVLVIGESASPDDDFMFPLAAGVDRNGNVYVFDAQTLELRRFSSTGTPATLIAKRGGGPGELTNPTSFLFDSVNDQFRICFRWTDAGPEDVEIVDYR